MDPLQPLPPWRWPLWGPWPPDDDQNRTPPPPIPETEIRPLAEQLSKQKPWLSPEEHWLAAEHALRQKPWRPWVIRFSGQQARSGWDWSELIIKVSVPVLIVSLGAGLSRCTAEREERIALNQRESVVVTSFIGEMQKLVLSDRLVPGKKVRSEFLVIPRELTIAALAQLNSDEAVLERNQILRFVRGLGLLEWRKGELFFQADLNSLNLNRAILARADLRGAMLVAADLSRAIFTDANLSGSYLMGSDVSEADLTRANLSGALLNLANLRGAGLEQANLSWANLFKADLRGAYLNGANLNGAFLDGALLNGSDLSGVQWNDQTKWPERSHFRDAKNIPIKLKKKLALP